jgi:hypothetical protein
MALLSLLRLHDAMKSAKTIRSAPENVQTASKNRVHEYVSFVIFWLHTHSGFRPVLRHQVVLAFVLAFIYSTDSWTSSGNTHAELIENLRRDHRITSDRVYNALLKVGLQS